MPPRSTMPPETPSRMKCLVNMNISVSEDRVQDASVSFSLSTPPQNVSATSSTDLVSDICDRPAQLEAPVSGTSDKVALSGDIIRRKRPRLASPKLGSNDGIGNQWDECIHDLMFLLQLVMPDFNKYDAIFDAFLAIIYRVGMDGVKRIRSFILEDCEWYRPGTWICLRNTFLRSSRVCLLDNEECDCQPAYRYNRTCFYLKKVDGGLVAIRIGSHK
ncbi:hypothetical protein F5Y00DRAFT_99834 [Daldinia vernicosa]|uniref:uncharacterized protein n=1 Tax=Daldinia vernicosa TaxID=114800 RepID=UPI00200829CE|nr:uncharacterized protein F5Y00DRAFT_99834 [Daldinia vernicosa]KAI0853353.1 hypothetical protein F5Y00DRAFT_99834 [Daldinia vernicosa]